MNNFVKLIRINIRYVLVFLILIFALIFGRNLQLSAEEKNLKLYFELLKKHEENIFTLDETEDQAEIRDLLATSANQYYRLIFDVQVKANLSATEISGIKLSENKTVKGSVEIFLKSDMGKKTKIGSLDLDKNAQFVMQEINFFSDDNYSSLLVQRVGLDCNSIIEFKNLHLSQLKCTNKTCFDNLKPTMFSQSSLIVDQGQENKENVIFKVATKNLYGQVFQAKSDNIAYLDLAINKKGSGGLGNYRLELHKAEKQINNFSVSPEVEAVTYFETFDLKRYQINNGVYHFPLVAKLEPDKYYYFALSGYEAKSNLINRLELFGTKNNSADGNGGAYISDAKKTSGSLYYKIYSFDKSLAAQQIMSANYFVEDLGNHQGFYSYRFSQTPSDYLDTIDLQVPDNASVYFDNVSRGVSASAIPGTSFSYMFDTVYPFSELYLKAEEFGGNFNKADFFYSYDNTNWQKIMADSNLSQSKNLEYKIFGDGQNHLLYLKISYMEDVAPVKLFGLKDLQIKAKLSMP